MSKLKRVFINCCNGTVPSRSVESRPDFQLVQFCDIYTKKALDIYNKKALPTEEKTQQLNDQAVNLKLRFILYRSFKLVQIPVYLRNLFLVQTPVLPKMILALRIVLGILSCDGITIVQ